MDLRRLLIGTSILGVALVASSVRAFQAFSTPTAEFSVGILVAFTLAAWAALLGLYLRDYRNAGVMSGMGPPPALDSVNVSPASHRATGNGRFSATVSAVSVPVADVARDELRVERFLRDASFPNDWSRRNAETWLRVFRLQHPYLAAELPPEIGQTLSRIRTEVAAEPLSQLRDEVRRYFGRNEMEWVEVPGSPPPESSDAQSRPSQADPGVGAAPTRLGGTTRTSGPSDSEGEGTTPPRRGSGSKSAGRPTERVLFDAQLSIEATGHAEVHFDLSKGTRLRGLARELTSQPFDLYIMDRKNYIRFAQEHESRDLLSGVDESLYDYKATIPKDDTWFVVVDTYGKVNDREVWLEVRATSPE